jgi:hypothetical protein
VVSSPDYLDGCLFADPLPHSPASVRHLVGRLMAAMGTGKISDVAQSGHPSEIPYFVPAVTTVRADQSGTPPKGLSANPIDLTPRSARLQETPFPEELWGPPGGAADRIQPESWTRFPESND